MRFGKIRILSFILTFALFFGNAASLTVYAAPPAEAGSIAAQSVKTGADNGSGKKTLSGIVITNLSEPSAGVPFDGTATVITAEGATWEIPVIWTDESGNIITTPVIGKKYIPTLVFFVPEGYTIQGINALGKFAVKLPAFLEKLYGTSDVLFTLDTSSGMTLISYGTSQYSMGSGNAGGTGSESEAAEVSSSSSNSDNIPYAPAPEAGIPEIVRIHCTEKIIETIDPGFLAQFVDIVKNRLIPQAVNLLQDNIPAYSFAMSDELGKSVGLIVYYGDDRFYSNVAGSSFNLRGRSAATNEHGVGEMGNLYLMIGVNAEPYIAQNPDGSYYINSTFIDLGNTLVHELMHSFMLDYTRYGMTMYNEDGFPAWFYEGIAQSVLNAYQDKANYYQALSDINKRGNYNAEKMMFDGEIDYSVNSILDRLNHENPQVRAFYDISNGGDDFAPYVTGYLAVAYLGYLAAKGGGEEALRNDGSYDTVRICGGVSTILERLHNNETLDQIISSISDYDSTADFQGRFMNGQAQEETDMAALGFVASYLTYLEGCKKPNGDGTRFDLGNGSILKWDQQYSKPLNYDTEAQSRLYHVEDVGDFVATGADPVRAWETGGVSNSGSYEVVLREENDAAALIMPEAAPELFEDMPETAVEAEPETEEAAEAEAAAVSDAPEEGQPAVTEEAPVADVPAKTQPEENQPADVPAEGQPEEAQPAVTEEASAADAPAESQPTETEDASDADAPAESQSDESSPMEYLCGT